MENLVSLIANREVIHLSVNPTYGNTFSAIDSNTFDADWDGEKYFTKCPQGEGATAAEAIDDLLEKLTEAA